MDLIETLENDYQWCKQYFYKILQDSKWTDGFRTYLDKCCNISELQRFYKLTMGLLNKFYIRYFTFETFKSILDEDFFIFYGRACSEEKTYLSMIMFSTDEKYINLNRIYYNFIFWSTCCFPENILKHNNVYESNNLIIQMFKTLVDNKIISSNDFFRKLFDIGDNLSRNLFYHNDYDLSIIHDLYITNDNKNNSNYGSSRRFV